MSPPCVGGRAGGALAKTHVDSQRRAPRLGSGGHPLPGRCSTGHRRLVHRRCRVSGAASTCGAEAGSWQSHARMRPPSSPGLELPVQLFGRPPRLYPGHQAAGRSPQLQRSLRLPSSPRRLTSSSRLKVLSRSGGKCPRDGERAAARPPSAVGHVEGESQLLPRDAGSPPLLLPPPAPLAPLTLTRGFTLASKAAPRPSRAAGAASTQATDVGGAAAAQPTACAAPTWGTDACWPQPVLSFAPPISHRLCAFSPRPPACAPPPPARPVRSECGGAGGAAGRPRQPMGRGLDAEIGKPLPKVGGKESGGPGCQSK